MKHSAPDTSQRAVMALKRSQSRYCRDHDVKRIEADAEPPLIMGNVFMTAVVATLDACPKQARASGPTGHADANHCSAITQQRRSQGFEA